MMMEIRDSRGRKVSLLNDELPRLSTLHRFPGNDHQAKSENRLPPLQRPSASVLQQHHQNYSSSSNPYSSTSERSTPPLHTPSLCRSDSSDSGALHSPSPPTPLSSGGLENLRQSLPKRLKSQKDLPGIDSLSRRPSSSFPPPPPTSSTSPSAAAAKLSRAQRSSMDFSSQVALGGGVSDYSLPVSSGLVSGIAPFDPLVLQSPAAVAPLSAQQPLPNPAAFDPSVAAAAAAATAVPPPPPAPQAPTQQQAGQQGQVYPAPVTQQRSQKKNSYPCPLSRQFNCPEYFTTSGHAARHAKKHTGKKDAICPECGKGFTRKDNMEQHRRTHANGRNTHHNSTSSASSNNASTDGTNSTSSSASATKTVPKADSDESKARKKVQQQRKTRPSSISTPAPVQVPVPNSMSMSRPSTATSAVPPLIDMLDPVLRDPNAIGFSPTAVDFGMYPFGSAGLTMDNGLSQNFQAPHAPMRSGNAGQGSASRMRHERRSSESMGTTRPQRGPTAPSLAPKLDALALVAEDVRRRDSDSSD